HLLQKTTPAGRDFPRGVGVRVVVGVHVPAIGRNLSNRIPALAQQLPESGRTIRARETATQAHNGNGLTASRFGRLQLGLHLLQGQEGLLEWGEGLWGFGRHDISPNFCSSIASTSSSVRSAMSMGVLPAGACTSGTVSGSGADTNNTCCKYAAMASIE